MNTKNCLIITMIFPLVGFISGALAQPYQIEARAGFSQFDITPPNGGSVDGNVIALSAVYYLQMVDTTGGPLLERPFLDKSAFVAGSFAQSKPDQGQDTDTIGIDARFVTQDDLIFELGYDKADAGVGGDDKTLGFGVGKYLDRNTTAVLFYETEDRGVDVDTFGGRYRHLTNNSAAGTSSAYEVGLALVDAPSDSGFEISLGGTYYPSEYLSVGVELEYLDIGNFDETDITLSGNNFFTDTLFAGLLFKRSSNSSDVDLDFIGALVGTRF